MTHSYSMNDACKSDEIIDFSFDTSYLSVWLRNVQWNISFCKPHDTIICIFNPQWIGLKHWLILNFVQLAPINVLSVNKHSFKIHYIVNFCSVALSRTMNSSKRYKIELSGNLLSFLEVSTNLFSISNLTVHEIIHKKLALNNWMHLYFKLHQGDKMYQYISQSN